MIKNKDDIIEKSLTMEDIYNSIKLLQYFPKGNYIIKDVFKKITISDIGIDKIELTPLGLKILDNFKLDGFSPFPNLKNIKISEFLGVKVVISNYEEKDSVAIRSSNNYKKVFQ